MKNYYYKWVGISEAIRLGQKKTLSSLKMKLLMLKVFKYFIILNKTLTLFINKSVKYTTSHKDTALPVDKKPSKDDKFNEWQRSRGDYRWWWLFSVI